MEPTAPTCEGDRLLSAKRGLRTWQSMGACVVLSPFQLSLHVAATFTTGPASVGEPQLPPAYPL